MAEHAVASVKDSEGELVARYHFEISTAGDVVTMLTRAASVAGRSRDNHVATVLTAQATMIAGEFHVQPDATDMMGDVHRFHQKFGHEYTGKPRCLPDELFDFRTKFHDEEDQEYKDEQEKLKEAIVRRNGDAIVNHLELQLDALLDEVFVRLGTADLQFGPAIVHEAWRRIVTANMAKVRADAAEDDAKKTGRDKQFDIVKPAGWLPPTHYDLVIDHAHKGE